MAPGPFAPLPAPAEWATSTAGYRLALRRWEAHGAVKAVVVLQHGGSLHSGYFGGLGRSLAASGYACVAMDLVGHGHSEGPTGPPPGTYIERFSCLVEDLRQLLAQEKARRPGRPLFVLAESMGAVLAIAVAVRKDPNLAGLIICGGAMRFAPSVAKAVPPSCCFPVIHLVARIFPLKRMPPASNYKESWASAFGDERWVQATVADPLSNSPSVAYLRTASEVLKAMQYMQAHMGDVECPLLVLHGEADTRADVEGARLLHRLAASADKQLKLYPQACHQLFQDSPENITRAIGDVKEWLDQRSPAPAACAAPRGGCCDRYTVRE